jgi:hypothetical protein
MADGGASFRDHVIPSQFRLSSDDGAAVGALAARIRLAIRMDPVNN